ncbi:hypothetical protein AVEN_258464-1 [Araneus ventricosus]|uniref:Uncharacterized protein n=1 Tax=Araneus ventricosus TaxID=182803 RepID=A0A4Y2SPS2_ARAVE|nr:hypothetical protein AVEN_258464-1 [Araneus ventricosus]
MRDACRSPLAEIKSRLARYLHKNVPGTRRKMFTFLTVVSLHNYVGCIKIAHRTRPLHLSASLPNFPASHGSSVHSGSPGVEKTGKRQKKEQVTSSAPLNTAPFLCHRFVLNSDLIGQELKRKRGLKPISLLLKNSPSCGKPTGC